MRGRHCRFETLEARQVLSVPTLAPIGDVTLYSGSPLHLPLDGYDADGSPLTFLAQSDNIDVETYIPEGNRSMRISVSKADGGEGDGPIQGEMILELYEDRAPLATSQIIDLANSGFYDGIVFHRVIDGFMIQGGDPTGTGSGSSPLPDFDDQFNVDLQHNRGGILSMAKSSDDTNNSQFFITEGPTRYLDFNHTIFGLLVEGEDVREAISGVLTDDNDHPLTEVVMDSVEIFVDQENGVLMLKAPQGYTGEANITITIVDGQGNQYPQTPFHVTVIPDPDEYYGYNSEPFLDEIPEIRTAVDTDTTVTIGYIDVEGDPCYILDEWFLAEPDVYNFNRYLPVISHNDLYYEIDPVTGVTFVSPSNGLVGIHPITVSAVYDPAWYPDAPYNEGPDARVDYQVVPVYIVPETAPAASLDMTLVLEPTLVTEDGEIDTLPQDQWIDEWDSFAIEVWTKIDDPNQFGVHTTTTDLVYDKDLFTATQIEYGPAFFQQRTGEINTADGVVEDLGGTTPVLTVNQHLGYRHPVYGADYAFDPTDVNLYGDNSYVLVARVYFEPNLNGPGVPHTGEGQYAAPITDLGFFFQNAEVKWSSVDATNLTISELQNAELWPMMFDYNDSGSVNLIDLSYFAAGYGHAVGDAGATWSWAGDYDHNGQVNLIDLAYFAANYQRDNTSPGRNVYADNFPTDWRPPAEGAPLLASPLDGKSNESGGDLASEDQGLLSARLAQAFNESLQRDDRLPRPHRNPAIVDLLMMEYGRPG
ncbi:MAG: peptidylprolyl isomerase [Pirellulales bacterium]|nr:peptidylprolyl isomerase [Pirellulales bacterium]